MEKGSRHTTEAKRKMRERKLGVPLKKEHREAIANANAGKAKKLVVGYSAVHKWAVVTMGTPTECEACGLCPEPRVRRRVQWANRSGEYRRDISDWVALCVRCHQRYDRFNLEITI